MDKSSLRKQMLAKRNSLSLEDAQNKSKKIIEKLQSYPDYRKAKKIMFYISKDKEVSTHEAIIEALKTKKVFVPKISNNGLLCCEISSMNNMAFNCFGVLEPNEEIICDVSKIDLIIVPGVAFDKSGHRIGFGKGYYDKFLKNTICKKIGLAFDFQIVDKLPADEWDEKLDKVISG